VDLTQVKELKINISPCMKREEVDALVKTYAAQGYLVSYALTDEDGEELSDERDFPNKDDVLRIFRCSTDT